MQKTNRQEQAEIIYKECLEFIKHSGQNNNYKFFNSLMSNLALVLIQQR